MTPEVMLSHPPRVLSQAQREAYFEAGYAMVESLVPGEVIEGLNAVTAGFIEESRALTPSTEDIDIGPGHSTEKPVVRHLIAPDPMHEDYWTFANGIIADAAADLLGPDVTFNHSKLNFKWSDGHYEVKWHQDISFYPHTNYNVNYNVLAIGCYLTDVTEDDDPIGVISSSHKGPIFEHFDANGVWTGSIRDDDIAAYDAATSSYLPGPKGSIAIHHSRAVHGSKPTTTANGRPLLVNAFAFAYTTPKSSHSHRARDLVRGQRATWAHHDPEPCPIPPDWSGGYTSIYAYQAAEAAEATPRDPGFRMAAG
tara:strand:+ start:10315 stop:11244 length:930 start_codon:yes stop_codon:yes gene_type:complete